MSTNWIGISDLDGTYRVELRLGKINIIIGSRPDDPAEPIRTPQPPEPLLSRPRQIRSCPSHRQPDQSRTNSALDQPGQQWQHKK